MIRILPSRSDPHHVFQIAVLQIDQDVSGLKIDIIDPVRSGTLRECSVGLADRPNPVRCVPDTANVVHAAYGIVSPSLMVVIQQRGHGSMIEAHRAERIVHQGILERCVNRVDQVVDRVQWRQTPEAARVFGNKSSTRVVRRAGRRGSCKEKLVCWRARSLVRLEHPICPTEMLRDIEVGINRRTGLRIDVFKGTVVVRVWLAASSWEKRIGAAGIERSLVRVAHLFEISVGMRRVVGVVQRHGEERDFRSVLIEAIALYVVVIRFDSAGSARAIRREAEPLE